MSRFCRASITVVFVILSLPAQQPFRPETPSKRPGSEVKAQPKAAQEKPGDVPKSSPAPSASDTSPVREPTPNRERDKPGKSSDGLQQATNAIGTLAQILLVGIGYWGVRTALRTLSAIEKQVSANEIAAEAALKGAKAAQESADTAREAAQLAEIALHKTERADILLDGVAISTYPDFNGHSVVSTVLKNFGRTRGNRAEITARLFIPGIELGPSEDATRIPSIAIAAGDKAYATFHPMADWLTEETFTKIVAGELTMRFEAEITYFDVFDQRHHTKCGGAFMPQRCSFRIDENQEAD